MKYLNTEIAMREFPEEITLAINLTNCPNTCKGCHSPILRENIGEELNERSILDIIKKNPGITCVGLMGGDGDTNMLKIIASSISNNYPYLKIGWYSGRDEYDESMSNFFDYIKFGSYQEKYGPLDSPTTNQIMYHINRDTKEKTNITKKFLRDKL